MTTPTIVVRPATLEVFGDIEPVINRACWCQWWRLPASEYERSTVDDARANWDRRREALRAQCGVEPPPGVIAYIDDVPVGWCGFGPRASMARLERSRTIPRVDDSPVWSIICFSVRPGYRRRGVAKALLAGAIECAKELGAVGLESYPTDPGNTRRQPTSSFTGFVRMFEGAGFHRVLETSSRADGLTRWVMRLDLLGRGAPRDR